MSVPPRIGSSGCGITYENRYEAGNSGAEPVEVAAHVGRGRRAIVHPRGVGQPRHREVEAMAAAGAVLDRERRVALAQSPRASRRALACARSCRRRPGDRGPARVQCSQRLTSHFRLSGRDLVDELRQPTRAPTRAPRDRPGRSVASRASSFGRPGRVLAVAAWRESAPRPARRGPRCACPRARARPRCRTSCRARARSRASAGRPDGNRSASTSHVPRPLREIKGIVGRRGPDTTRHRAAAARRRSPTRRRCRAASSFVDVVPWTNQVLKVVSAGNSRPARPACTKRVTAAMSAPG